MKLAQLFQGDRDFQEERALMEKIVQDTKALRDHLYGRYELFNTPSHTDATGGRYYNTQVFLRADSKRAAGVYLFQPIGGKSDPGLGSNQKVVSDMWEKLVEQARSSYNRAFAIYTNFFGNQNNLGLTGTHFKILEKDINVLDDDIQRKLKEFFRGMEDFLKRIPIPDGYSQYYLFGFEKPKIDALMAELTKNINKLVYLMEPYQFAQKEESKLQKEMEADAQRRQELMKGQAPQFPLSVQPGMALSANPMTPQ